MPEERDGGNQPGGADSKSSLPLCPHAQYSLLPGRAYALRIDFLYPISVNGSRIVYNSNGGRDYAILYLLTKWANRAQGGY